METSNEYKQAIAQAKANLADLKERGEDAIGGDTLAFMNSLFTPEEIAASNLRVSLIGELSQARQEKGISQKKLEKLSGVKQSIIARIEKGQTNLPLDTFLKVLAPFGKTLAIVPIKQNKHVDE